MFVPNKHTIATTILPHRNPNVKEEKNFSSAIKSIDPNSKFRYANNDIKTAVKGAGIPNNTAGNIDVAFCELFAPLTDYTTECFLPKGGFGFFVDATACP